MQVHSQKASVRCVFLSPFGVNVVLAELGALQHQIGMHLFLVRIFEEIGDSLLRNVNAFFQKTELPFEGIVRQVNVAESDFVGFCSRTDSNVPFFQTQNTDSVFVLLFITYSELLLNDLRCFGNTLAEDDREEKKQVRKLLTVKILRHGESLLESFQYSLFVVPSHSDLGNDTEPIVHRIHHSFRKLVLIFAHFDDLLFEFLFEVKKT